METKILLTFNMSYKNIHDIQMNKIKTQYMYITKEYFFGMDEQKLQNYDIIKYPI